MPAVKKKSMHSRIFFLSVAVFVAVLSSAWIACSRQAVPVQVEAALPDKLELYYFYDELCASCDGAEEFRSIAAENLADIRGFYPYDIYVINVFTESGRAAYERRTDSMGLDRETLSLPLLIAGGKLFQGNDTIRGNLREAFLTAGEDLFINRRPYNPARKKSGAALFEDIPYDKAAVTVVYFYRTVCDECNSVKPFIDALPQELLLGGVETKLNVIRFNTRSGNNNERIAAFFDYYNVPDADRMVPIVFTASGCFAGQRAITEQLPAALTAPGLPILDNWGK
jgi:thiol-disulfide isomerase/thioredoxin